MRYPQDRFGFLLFQMDENFSAFSNEKFYPEIYNEPDPTVKKALINAKWTQDISQWLPVLSSQPNIGYHAAFWRSFNESHCLTIVDFANTGIEEIGQTSISPFIDSTLSRSDAPMRSFETDQVATGNRAPPADRGGGMAVPTGADLLSPSSGKVTATAPVTAKGTA